MTPFLLPLLGDPKTGEALTLDDAGRDDDGIVVSGTLRSPAGSQYPIINGIPRFVPEGRRRRSVASFGTQWNTLDFTQFKDHWVHHTVRNTFGDLGAFRDKVIVDAGAGSGAQARWMLEAGARHVILIDLSDSVDGVVRRNLESTAFRNYDIVQASIDEPPLRPGSIEGMILCHNVIQHTPSVRKTAKALFGLAKPGSEFIFNCYDRFDTTWRRKAKWAVYQSVRRLHRRWPHRVRLAYAGALACLRQIPGLGTALEASGLCLRGPISPSHEGMVDRVRRSFRATRLNTYDWFGAHEFQHHLSPEELLELVHDLQPSREKVLNLDSYRSQPRPPGCALRLIK